MPESKSANRRTRVLLTGATGDYAEFERRSAQNFAAAAQAGPERIVYLGGVQPQGAPSRHLKSRLRTGQILRRGRVINQEPSFWQSMPQHRRTPFDEAALVALEEEAQTLPEGVRRAETRLRRLSVPWAAIQH